MKIAMWSGPRNLSTAMMYSFGSRSDFKVWDEPFYAAYLAAAGVDHPMRADVLAAHDQEPDSISYQIMREPGNVLLKLMSFHMLPGFSFRWAEDCAHIHLIRHPARVLASYAAKRERPDLRDIGFQQQAEIFDRFPGPVVDTERLRRDPEAGLRALCAQLGIAFDEAMLKWPAGPKPFDGVWAAHWYDAAHRSTGFAGPEGPLPELEGDLATLVETSMPYYERLVAMAI